MEKIIIEHSPEQGWIISQGTKESEKMGWDEMIGLLTSLTLPEPRPCLQWMHEKAPLNPESF